MLLPEIAKKNVIKPPFGGSRRSFKVIDLGALESVSPVLVRIRSKSKSISNRFVAVQVNSSRNHTFSRGIQL